MGFETMGKRNVAAYFGPRKTNLKYGGDSCQDRVQVSSWVFNYNDLPAASTINLEKSIPAGATIKAAYMRILTAFTSTSTTTDLSVGFADKAGTEIDLDGLITAAQATQTTIAVVGSIIDGASGTAGALIGKTIGASAGELVVTPTVADLLTGRAEVVVEWMPAFPAQQF